MAAWTTQGRDGAEASSSANRTGLGLEAQSARAGAGKGQVSQVVGTVGETLMRKKLGGPTG